MLEAAGEVGIQKLTLLANKMCNTGETPKKIKENICIAIPKKMGTVECEKHRTICLVILIGKEIFRVIGKRIKRKIRENVEEKQ